MVQWSMGVPVYKGTVNFFFPLLRRKLEANAMRWKWELRHLPTQWMQAVQRGKTKNRRLDRTGGLADVGFGGI